MEKQKTFGEFIKNYSFIIPDYQRAYSWEEKQLNPFINDILEHCDNNDNPFDDTTYYFGHYILENSKDSNEFEIVDGQQRISTVYLFLLVCSFSNLKNENYIKDIDFKPVSYDCEGFELIKNILLSKNDIETKLNDLFEKASTSSLKRMIEAVKIFIKAFSATENPNNSIKLNVNAIDKYIAVINNAYCSVAVFNNKSVASQIFELHNTRGIKLTETEKVKALLMKNIYVNSSTAIEAENSIKEIQLNFARIFELEEKANQVWLRGEMQLDTILMYHLRAIEDGYKIEDFHYPLGIEGERGSFEYVKNSLTRLTTKEEIVNYSKNISKEFAKSMEILTIDIPNVDQKDNNHLIGDVLLLDKNKSLIFLLRAFRNNTPIDYKLIERWENFVLSYDIIYWNDFFYNKRYRGNFDRIYASLKPNEGFKECNELLLKYYENVESFGSDWGHLGNNTKNLFENGKKKWFSSTYEWSKTGYFLYKYEIHKGADVEKIRKFIFKEDKVSIDHIVARGLSWESLGYVDYEKLPEDNERKKEANKVWEEITRVINGIGNLALSTASNNSSDSNGLPNKHLNTYEKFGFIETTKQVESWKEPKEFASKINQRSEDILRFISDEIINKTDLWE
jgi:hypothetical protein